MGSLKVSELLLTYRLLAELQAPGCEFCDVAVKSHGNRQRLSFRPAMRYKMASACGSCAVSVPTNSELNALARSVGARLLAGRQMLVTAESCTGGWIAKCMTEIPGSSGWFDCGLVAYSYEAKQALLGVRPQTLEEFGAVSRETVVEMVSGALVHSGATIAVAVTGIAGPDGGSEDKPVGMVWIGWKRRGGYARAEPFHFDGDRDAVRRQTVATALHGLEHLLDADSP